MTPTIVLVHGAFAESAIWEFVSDRLLNDGHRVTAASNPLRGVAADAAAVSDLVRTIDGPIVLAAHSYGGAVITNVDPDAGEIVALVYVSAFAPAPGESSSSLAAMFPGSALDEASVQPVPRSDGTTDLYIKRDRFHTHYCHDVPAPHAARLALTQRPASKEALAEPSGPRPLWKEVPSWFLVGEKDLIIPAAAQRFMADRARARCTIEIAAASHALTVSEPEPVTDLILDAAALHVAA